MPNFQTICQIEDVADGSARLFMVGDQPVGIFKIDGEFFAIDNRCPHAGASLAHGIIEGKTVYCRIHHWQFQLDDGKRLDEDCPNTNARCFPIRIQGSELQVDLDFK